MRPFPSLSDGRKMSKKLEMPTIWPYNLLAIVCGEPSFMMLVGKLDKNSILKSLLVCIWFKRHDSDVPTSSSCCNLHASINHMNLHY